MKNKANLIEKLFLELVATRSDTNTTFECEIEEVIFNWLQGLNYFQKFPEQLGTKIIFNDAFHRKVVWALVKGKGRKTIVLVHHHDAVGTEDYGKLRPISLDPIKLFEKLKTKKLSNGVQKDIDSGEWLFGRGTADMKAGAAIQMALIEKFSQEENFDGNLLLLSVPDEESLSRGMLTATELMQDLKENFDLDYILTINSEPYFNNSGKKAIMYEGSVGKIMPVVYVKGVKSHIGDPYNGINPSLILANIQRYTELNVKLCDRISDDATPPPIWVNLKDRKKFYDASIPEAATGYFNWLTFTRSPVKILETLTSICEDALIDTIKHFKFSRKEFYELIPDKPDSIEFEPRVMDFQTLFKEAIANGGKEFEDSYNSFEEEVKILFEKNIITLPEATLRLLEFAADSLDIDEPTVVIAISGPYYPHISNALIKDGEKFDLLTKVNRVSKELFGVEYQSQAYFMGISDLSYASWVGSDEDVKTIKTNSPGWDTIYKIPFKAIQSLNSPVVNIGPWGKDLHKPTERVYKKDLLERIPTIISTLINEVLEQA